MAHRINNRRCSPRPPPARDTVYVALWKDLEGSQSSAVFHKRYLSRLVATHHSEHVVMLARRHSVQGVADQARALLDDGVFANVEKAKLEFPHLFQTANGEDNDFHLSGSSVMFPMPIQYRLLSSIQHILEVAYYEYAAKARLPFLAEKNWTCPEAVELSQWIDYFIVYKTFHGDNDLVNTTLEYHLGTLGTLWPDVVHRRRVEPRAIDAWLCSAENMAHIMRQKSYRSFFALVRQLVMSAADDLRAKKSAIHAGYIRFIDSAPTLQAVPKDRAREAKLAAEARFLHEEDAVGKALEEQLARRGIRLGILGFEFAVKLPPRPAQGVEGGMHGASKTTAGVEEVMRAVEASGERITFTKENNFPQQPDDSINGTVELVGENTIAGAAAPSTSEELATRSIGKEPAAPSTSEEPAAPSTGKEPATRSAGRKPAKRSADKAAASRSAGRNPAKRSAGKAAAARSAVEEPTTCSTVEETITCSAVEELTIRSAEKEPAKDAPVTGDQGGQQDGPRSDPGAAQSEELQRGPKRRRVGKSSSAKK